MTTVLPQVHFGQPGKGLDWRLVKHDEPDDDVARPMELSARKMLKADPFALFDHHGKPEEFVDNERASTILTQFQDQAAKLPRAVIQEHMNANCVPMAIAIHNHTKKPIMSITGRYIRHSAGRDVFMHAYVHHKKGFGIDAKGIRPVAHILKDVQKGLAPNSLKTQPIDPKYVRWAHKNMNNEIGNATHHAKTILDLKPKMEKAGEHTGVFHYQPLLRPAHFSTLPQGVQWEYAELPRDFDGHRPELKRGMKRYGIIKLNRRLTDEECHHFDLKEVA